MPRHPPCALKHLTTTRCSHPLCNTQHTTTPLTHQHHHTHPNPGECVRCPARRRTREQHLTGCLLRTQQCASSPATRTGTCSELSSRSVPPSHTHRSLPNRSSLHDQVWNQ